MCKLCQTSQSSFSLLKPLCCFTLSVSFVVKSQKNLFFLDFLVQKIFFDISDWLQLLSNKIEWFISFFLVLIILLSLSLRHSSMSSVGKKTSFGFRWKLYCYSSSSHLTRENFVSRFVHLFRFHFLVYWEHYCKMY